MGRRTDTDINIKNYRENMEDRYLIGYLKQGNKKVPVTFCLNIRKGIGSLQPGYEAIADQKAINALSDHAGKIPCAERYLLTKPYVFYGFSNPPEDLNRQKEAEMHKVIKKLGETLSEREVARKLYGDEVYFMVGKFRTPKGDMWMALGKVKKPNGEETVIRQTLAKEREGVQLEIRCLGMDGICHDTYRKYDNTYYTWSTVKQSLGVPKMEITRKGTGKTVKTYIRFDPCKGSKFEIYDPDAEDTKLFDYEEPDQIEETEEEYEQ